MTSSASMYFLEMAAALVYAAESHVHAPSLRVGKGPVTSGRAVRTAVAKMNVLTNERIKSQPKLHVQGNGGHTAARGHVTKS